MACKRRMKKLSFKHVSYYVVLVRELVTFDVPLDPLVGLQRFQDYAIRIRIEKSVNVCTLSRCNGYVEMAPLSLLPVKG